MTREPGSAPPRHAHGDLTSLAPHERLPEILVVPRERTPTGAAARENPEDAPIIARCGPSLTAWHAQQARVFSQSYTGGLTPFRTISGLEDVPVVTREDSGELCFSSRQGLTHRVRLECDPDILVAPGGEHYFLDTSLGEVSLPCSDSRATPSSPS